MAAEAERSNLLRVEDVAEMLNVRESTIYEWARMEYIPHVRIGSGVRFDRKAIDQWLVDKKKPGRKERVS